VLLELEDGYGPYAVRGIGEGPHIPPRAMLIKLATHVVHRRNRCRCTIRLFPRFVPCLMLSQEAGNS
jgi:hypothetical protein